MKYRKKPVVIEAVKFNGSTTMKAAVGRWIAGGPCPAPHTVHTRDCCKQIAIETLEGTMFADPGDYIIKGVKGEFYPCKPDIFDATYELVEEER